MKRIFDFFGIRPVCLLTNRFITFTKHGVYIKASSKLWDELVGELYEP